MEMYHSAPVKGAKQIQAALHRAESNKVASASFAQHVKVCVGVLRRRLVVQHVVEERRVVMEEYRFVSSEGTSLPHNKGTALQAAG